MSRTKYPTWQTWQLFLCLSVEKENFSSTQVWKLKIVEGFSLHTTKKKDFWNVRSVSPVMGISFDMSAATQYTTQTKNKNRLL